MMVAARVVLVAGWSPRLVMVMVRAWWVVSVVKVRKGSVSFSLVTGSGVLVWSGESGVMVGVAMARKLLVVRRMAMRQAWWPVWLVAWMVEGPS